MKIILKLFIACVSIIPLNAQIATIQPGDSVDIILRGVPGDEAQLINGVYQISKDGRIIGLPFLNDRKIQASGLSQAELAEKLSEIYKDAQIYTDPTFSARIDGDGEIGRTVTLGGEVAKPGPIPYRQGMTIFDAVMAAGGDDKFGSLKRVSIIRKGKTIGVYDLRNDEGKSVKVLPYDSILVDDKTFWEP